ncbi:MAG: transposase [Paracoccaceae bacterium]|jgi:transposase
MGRSRGGLTTKIHALVDAEGRPIRLILTPDQAGDAPAAAELLTDLAPGATLLADRAYDTNAIRNLAAERGAWANIPPKTTRKDAFSFSPRCDRRMCRWRRPRRQSLATWTHR